MAKRQPDWNPTPTPSSGTFVGQAALFGLPCSENDAIGAFTASNLCVGSTNIILADGTSYFQLTIYGDDATTPSIDGMIANDEFTLKLWVAESGETLELEPPIAGWASTNGAPIPGLDDPTVVYAFGGPLQGCTNPDFLEFNPLAGADDGSCITLIVSGCTDPAYLEYIPEANVEDDSCLTLAVPGCTASDYLEFNDAANSDDGSCETLIVAGCTDPTYQEFEESANVDNGSCVSLHVLGCTDPDFLEFDPTATLEDGSCVLVIVAGCLNPHRVQLQPRSQL